MSKHFDCTQPEMKVVVCEKGGECKFNHNIGDKFKISEMGPKGLCVHAYHAVLPYIHTMTNEGWMRWVAKDDGVIVQCPRHDKNMVLKVKKPGEDILLEVFQVRGSCSNNHKVGEKYVLEKDTLTVCPKVFDLAYSCCFSKNKHLELCCPKPEGIKIKKS